MLTIEQICTTAMKLAERGDKPSSDDFAEALRTLMVILSDWAAVRDIQFWNLAEQTEDIPIGDRVIADDSTVYQCIVDHTATTDDYPTTGDLYKNYWKASRLDTDATAWTETYPYAANKTLTIDDVNLEDVLALRLQYAGQFSPIEKISKMEFEQLPKDELGTPVKACVEKSGAGVTVRLWPNNELADAKLFYYAVKRPSDYTGTDLFPLADQWAQALYYALAVELGFMYNISMDRLKVLGLKARDEFNKAFQTNESEPDECFVKPCY